MLNFDAASAALDLVAHKQLASFDSVELSVRTRRLIERLLDQIDAQGRQATDSEDSWFRRAIAAYAAGMIEQAISYAFRASKIGVTPIAFEMFTPGFGPPKKHC
jgi:hypothetical protein